MSKYSNYVDTTVHILDSVSTQKFDKSFFFLNLGYFVIISVDIYDFQLLTAVGENEWHLWSTIRSNETYMCLYFYGDILRENWR